MIGLKFEFIYWHEEAHPIYCIETIWMSKRSRQSCREKWTHVQIKENKKRTVSVATRGVNDTRT